VDWGAFFLSLKLAVTTTVLLIPLAVLLVRPLARWRSPAKSVLEALLALPLVLPPTVLGYYLLVGLGRVSPLGRAFEAAFGTPLVFSFTGLVAASLIANIPFAVQPIQRACEALPRDITDAAWVSGLTRRAAFWRIELPLISSGVLSAAVLTFAHTMGEFGVVRVSAEHVQGLGASLGQGRRVARVRRGQGGEGGAHLGGPGTDGQGFDAGQPRRNGAA